MGVPIAPNIKADFEWDAPSGTWKRSTNGEPHLLENDAQIAPQNVIVQFAPYSRFAEDTKVTFPEVIGSGDALDLRRRDAGPGQVVEAGGQRSHHLHRRGRGADRAAARADVDRAGRSGHDGDDDRPPAAAGTDNDDSLSRPGS